MSTWQVRDAHARLREVIDKALSEGPRTITDNGVGVIVLAEEEYRMLAEQADLQGASAQRSEG